MITTPEKWDGITRSWEIRQYVKDVALVVIDEIHLLGVERGAVLEAIITRLVSNNLFLIPGILILCTCISIIASLKFRNFFLD